MACKKEHSKTDEIIKNLPVGQEGRGRHKCAACAYEIGYHHGLAKEENINLGGILDSIEESQKKEGIRRHKSPHAAYSLGYFNGVIDSYK